LKTLRASLHRWALEADPVRAPAAVRRAARIHVAHTEDVAIRTYDFSPLWRSTVGFDRLFDLINNEIPNVQDTYPPYDIVRTGEESYRVTLALAGFTPEQITVTAHQNRLIVTGAKGDNGNGKQDYIYQSIAARPFERNFSLADHVEVEGATFDNGLLHIDLVRRVPEAMKPRRIEIGAGPAAVKEKTRAIKAA
jgi:molecular chaperone IbpA